MRTLITRNVHAALPVALNLLHAEGVQRDSRNGPVLQMPTPVSTVYTSPVERVLFHPERDANPFLHLYESLWMLAGRDDVEPLKRYAKQFEKYTDDGSTLHGAYGHRWRRRFGFDQLQVIAERLRANTEDRRCVLQMWDARLDLRPTDEARDLPCNDTATFQINPVDGALDMVVFCRSNDIVWGAYGANAVHFSFLLEYMARWIGVPVGTYTQISVNWHGYLSTLQPVQPLRFRASGCTNPYDGRVSALTMPSDIKQVDEAVKGILLAADNGFSWGIGGGETLWHEIVSRVLYAHHIHKTRGPQAALDSLAPWQCNLDWVVAAQEWLERRVEKQRAKDATPVATMAEVLESPRESIEPSDTRAAAPPAFPEEEEI